MALTLWHGVGGGAVTLRSIQEDIRRSGASAPLFHARATAAGTTDWVSMELCDGNTALGLLTGLFDSLITLEGEWHELETKREKARKRKKEAAG